VRRAWPTSPGSCWRRTKPRPGRRSHPT
jgi:hypothetical protein